MPQDWADVGPLLDRWIERAAAGLAYALVAIAAVIDVPTAIIDGGFPPDVRRRLVVEVRRLLASHDLQGLNALQVVEGSLGGDARGIGAAALPFLANFAQDREVMFKD